ncbi:MAG: TetR/AcrR family transcriptional regulator [Deltaproteobacteria bacterium]
MSASSPARVDGRTARSIRSRQAVVEALLDLLEEGKLRPTAAQIADRAGLSLRSVFQHFENLENLFAAAAEGHLARLAPLRTAIPRDRPLAERLDLFSERRAKLLEAITPVRRASLRVEPFSDEVARRLDASRELGRREVAVVFAPELGRYAEPARRLLLARMSASSGWAMWDALRRHEGLEVAEARMQMREILAALLAPDPPV